MEPRGWSRRVSHMCCLQSLLFLLFMRHVGAVILSNYLGEGQFQLPVSHTDPLFRSSMFNVSAQGVTYGQTFCQDGNTTDKTITIGEETVELSSGSCDIIIARLHPTGHTEWVFKASNVVSRGFYYGCSYGQQTAACRSSIVVKASVMDGLSPSDVQVGRRRPVTRRFIFFVDEESGTVKFLQNIVNGAVFQAITPDGSFLVVYRGVCESCLIFSSSSLKSGEVSFETKLFDVAPFEFPWADDGDGDSAGTADSRHGLIMLSQSHRILVVAGPSRISFHSVSDGSLVTSVNIRTDLSISHEFWDKSLFCHTVYGSYLNCIWPVRLAINQQPVISGHGNSSVTTKAFFSRPPDNLKVEQGEKKETFRWFWVLFDGDTGRPVARGAVGKFPTVRPEISVMYAEGSMAIAGYLGESNELDSSLAPQISNALPLSVLGPATISATSVSQVPETVGCHIIVLNLKELTLKQSSCGTVQRRGVEKERKHQQTLSQLSVKGVFVVIARCEAPLTMLDVELSFCNPELRYEKRLIASNTHGQPSDSGDSSDNISDNYILDGREPFEGEGDAEEQDYSEVFLAEDDKNVSTDEKPTSAQLNPSVETHRLDPLFKMPESRTRKKTSNDERSDNEDSSSLSVGHLNSDTSPKVSPSSEYASEGMAGLGSLDENETSDGAFESSKQNFTQSSTPTSDNGDSGQESVAEPEPRYEYIPYYIQRNMSFLAFVSADGELLGTFLLRNGTTISKTLMSPFGDFTYVTGLVGVEMTLGKEEQSCQLGGALPSVSSIYTEPEQLRSTSDEEYPIEFHAVLDSELKCLWSFQVSTNKVGIQVDGSDRGESEEELYVAGLSVKKVFNSLCTGEGEAESCKPSGGSSIEEEGAGEHPPYPLCAERTPLVQDTGGDINFVSFFASGETVFTISPPLVQRCARPKLNSADAKAASSTRTSYSDDSESTFDILFPDIIVVRFGMTSFSFPINEMCPGVSWKDGGWTAPTESSETEWSRVTAKCLELIAEDPLFKPLVIIARVGKNGQISSVKYLLSEGTPLPAASCFVKEDLCSPFAPLLLPETLVMFPSFEAHRAINDTSTVTIQFDGNRGAASTSQVVRVGEKLVSSLLMTHPQSVTSFWAFDESQVQLSSTLLELNTGHIVVEGKVCGSTDLGGSWPRLLEGETTLFIQESRMPEAADGQSEEGSGGSASDEIAESFQQPYQQLQKREERNTEPSSISLMSVSTSEEEDWCYLQYVDETVEKRFQWTPFYWIMDSNAETIYADIIPGGVARVITDDISFIVSRPFRDRRSGSLFVTVSMIRPNYTPMILIIVGSIIAGCIVSGVSIGCAVVQRRRRRRSAERERAMDIAGQTPRPSAGRRVGMDDETGSGETESVSTEDPLIALELHEE